MNKLKKLLDILINIIYSIVIFALIFIIILILKTDIVKNIYDDILISTLEKSLLEYNISENNKFNYLYYDSDISNSEKENIENVLESLEHFQNEFIENKLRVVVSRNKVYMTTKLLFKNLAKFETDDKTNVSGIYCPDYKLIILDVYDLDTVYNLVKKDAVFISDILDISRELNASTLLHEIGHFLDDINENKLVLDKSFVDTYINEKDILFDESEEYYKSTIEEYVAESISRVLMINLGLIDDSELLNSDTYAVINEYLNQFSIN